MSKDNRSEFKKARDEAATIDKTKPGIRDHCFLRGSDWAYEWCMNQPTEKQVWLTRTEFYEKHIQQQAIIERLKEALEFYAKPESIEPSLVENKKASKTFYPPMIKKDFYDVAEQALADVKELEK